MVRYEILVNDVYRTFRPVYFSDNVSDGKQVFGWAFHY